jgi:magnesium chelatase family protein
LVGLPEAAVRESKERVRAALATAGFDFPVARITVNLSPADLPKEGGRFDLPIAVGILAAEKIIPASALRHREFYGELSLAGELRETRKLLPALMRGVQSGHELILPAANALEAGLVGNPRLKLVQHLAELVAALNERQPLKSSVRTAEPTVADRSSHDLTDVRGQFAGKRALELAASGEHGLLFIGPPGTGKTLLAQRLPSLLPPLSPEETLEVASLQSAAGQRPSGSARRPFRNPQHTASVAALIGGGAAMRPGELSLAHRGVLFLDELPEFPRNALEALREPMESGEVLLTRLKRSYRFPARFQLVTAMNPCPCGYAGDVRGRCRCTPGQVARYRHRISGPLADRIDIHVELAALPPEHLLAAPDPETAESSAMVARRVTAARRLQLSRQGKLNARLSVAEIHHHCELSRESRSLLATAITRLGLSPRAYHRVLKVARTCADLADSAQIRLLDVAEAVKLRVLDRPTC